jgi:hypothetical protein
MSGDFCSAGDDRQASEPANRVSCFDITFMEIPCTKEQWF